MMSHAAGSSLGVSTPKTQRQDIEGWYSQQFGYSERDCISVASSSHGVPTTSKAQLTTMQHEMGKEGISDEARIVLFQRMLDVREDETVDRRTAKVFLIKAFQCLPINIQDMIEKKFVLTMTNGECSLLGPEFVSENILVPQFKEVVEEIVRIFCKRTSVDISPAIEDKKNSYVTGERTRFIPTDPILERGMFPDQMKRDSCCRSRMCSSSGSNSIVRKCVSALLKKKSKK